MEEVSVSNVATVYVAITLASCYLATYVQTV